MKAIAVVGKNKVAIVDDYTRPEVGDYGALIKIRSCGFCNQTDMHIIANTLSKEEGMGELPLILGHEACGDIVEMGPKVRYLKMGDRYIRPNNRPDEKYSLTYGNMTEYGLVVDHQAMLEDGYAESDLPFYGNHLFGFAPNFAKIPTSIDPIDGGVMLSLFECYSGVKNFGIGAGASVLVYGCGPMGQGCMQVMKAMGVSRIVAVDSVPSRLEIAKDKIGVDKTINFMEESVASALNGELFDFTFDAAGVVSILEDSSQFLKYGGKVCALGVLPAGKEMLNPHKLKNNTSLHVQMQPYKRFAVADEVVALVEQGVLNPKDFYSHVLPYQDVEKAMELVSNRQCLKVVLSFE